LGANGVGFDLDVDKTSFIPGETLWFKALMLFVSGKRAIGQIKTILHVSLVAPN
jgi:hypothetical protein